MFVLYCQIKSINESIKVALSMVLHPSRPYSILSHCCENTKASRGCYIISLSLISQAKLPQYCLINDFKVDIGCHNQLASQASPRITNPSKIKNRGPVWLIIRNISLIYHRYSAAVLIWRLVAWLRNDVITFS